MNGEPMDFFLAFPGIIVILLVLIDGFEVIVLPRRITRPYRFARMFYRHSWRLWRSLALLTTSARRRETLLSFFGPLSLLGLIASWVVVLVLGFAWLHWSLGSPLNLTDANFFTYAYLSGTTFFTLGYGDVT